MNSESPQSPFTFFCRVHDGGEALWPLSFPVVRFDLHFEGRVGTDALVTVDVVQRFCVRHPCCQPPLGAFLAKRQDVAKAISVLIVPQRWLCGGQKERGALVSSNERDFELSTAFGSTPYQNCNCSTYFPKEMARAPPPGPLPASTAGAVLPAYRPVDDQLVGSPSASAEPRWCHSRCCRVPTQKQTAQVGLRKQ